MSNKILCVEDDIHILSGFQRTLRSKFEMVGALGGEKGLKAIETQGPFAVILSDYRMPGMNGIEFLARAREKSPDSVQIMLTGGADLETAIALVNECGLFRFLTKPCPPELLAETLAAALERHHLVSKEHVALEGGAGSDARNTLPEQPNTAQENTPPGTYRDPPASTSAASSNVDASPRLRGPSEAELAIDTAIDTGDLRYLAVFCVRRMSLTLTRFGDGVGEQVMALASQHVATHVERSSECLFRWKGPALVALLDRGDSADLLRTELQRALAAPISQFFETESRSVYLPIKMSVEVIALKGAYLEEVLEQVEAFIQRESDLRTSPRKP